jgi:hypothetical protein
MSKKRATRFEDMTVDEIFAAWERSARAGLRAGLTYAPEIFGPRSTIVTNFKLHISRRMAAEPLNPFNAADFRNSTRVARDVGRICSIIAAADPDHVVQKDVFERATQLAKLHAACPSPRPTRRSRGPLAGGGRWCEAS